MQKPNEREHLSPSSTEHICPLALYRRCPNGRCQSPLMMRPCVPPPSENTPTGTSLHQSVVSQCSGKVGPVSFNIKQRHFLSAAERRTRWQRSYSQKTQVQVKTNVIRVSKLVWPALTLKQTHTSEEKHNNRSQSLQTASWVTPAWREAVRTSNSSPSHKSLDNCRNDRGIAYFSKKVTQNTKYYMFSSIVSWIIKDQQRGESGPKIEPWRIHKHAFKADLAPSYSEKCLCTHKVTIIFYRTCYAQSINQSLFI